jgi:hypothetical protein
MTATGFTRRNYGRGHAYYLDGRKLDGVTTILSKGLPKPALVQWAANCAADLACDEWDQLAELPLSERRKRLAKAADAKRSAAAVRGTQVHALADKLAQGLEVTVPDELAGHVESCVRFLNEWEPVTLLTETPVYHDTYLYAGTLDLVVEMAGKRWLLDFKTSASGAYGDTAFQLAAYKHATHCLTDGTVQPMGHIDECGVVWLRADGYDLYPYCADQGIFRQFLYIQQVAKCAEDSRDYKGDALTPPVRTQA